MIARLPPVARRTFLLERARAIAGGVLETAGTTFLLTIAVKAFHASALAKGFIAAGGSAGLLASLFMPGFARRIGLTNQRAAAICHLAAAACLAIPALLPNYPFFVAGGFLSFAAMTSSIPLLTQIFQDNYPDKCRGSLFASTVVWRICSAGIFSLLAGWFLAGDILGRHPALLGSLSAAAALAGWCLWLIPSAQPHAAIRPEPSQTHPNPLRVLQEDAVFRSTILIWMLMGIANLTMVPLRIEYLANPKYGIAMDAAQIALVTGVIPNVTRLIMSRVWGFLFDRVNFFLLRIVLNAGFMAGILAFFLGDSTLSITIAAAIFGISMAGGDIAWSLWVTKLAPPARVSEYMAVHTFFTGVRGVVTPFLAFQIVKVIHPSTVAACSAGLIAVACLLLMRDARTFRTRRPATPLIVEGDEG